MDPYCSAPLGIRFFLRSPNPMTSLNPKAAAEKALGVPPSPATPAAAEKAGAAAHNPPPLAAAFPNPTSAPDAGSAAQQPNNHGWVAAAGFFRASEAGPATDLQKKFRRAERFRMPVLLSEEEKRTSRAKRFGTGPALTGRKNAGKLEEKRKARAERFGLKYYTVADEEVKKKARLERFAPYSKKV